MAVKPQYLAYILEQLSAMPALRPNRMFSGVGFYSEDVFFGLVHDDTLYFKTGEANIGDYVARSMPKFLPFPERTKQVLGYHQVPADVIEDADQLIAWARKAKEAALAKRAAKAPRAKSAVARKQPLKSAADKLPRKPARKVAHPPARKSARKPARGK